jgi:alpha-L-rhamnosidase
MTLAVSPRQKDSIMRQFESGGVAAATPMAGLERLDPLGEQPFVVERNAGAIWNRDRWPARWITTGGPWATMPVVLAFRLRLTLDRPTDWTLHVSGDQRYDLWINGQWVGAGPERGDFNHWFFESYRLRAEPGDHCITARVWFAGDDAPIALMGRGPAFVLAGEGEALDAVTTGRAAWQARALRGYRYDLGGDVPGFESFVGKRTTLNTADRPELARLGEGEGWLPATAADPAECGYPADMLSMRVLTPAPLPALERARVSDIVVRHVGVAPAGDAGPKPIDPADHRDDESAQWTGLLRRSEPLTVSAHTARRVILDFDRYACVWPRLATEGGDGARIAFRFAETLYPQPQPVYDPPKPHRDSVDGMYFRGLGDRFELVGDDSRSLDTLWWRAGRYVEVDIRTSDEPLTLRDLAFDAHQYPTRIHSRFHCSDSQLNAILPLCAHSLKVSSLDAFFDSPYYEQLSYLGDSRVSALLHYATTRDHRLPRKVLEMFGGSVLPEGFIQTRYPCRTRQVIPTFCPFWLGMLVDYAVWTGDLQTVARYAHVARGVMDAYGRYRTESGLIGVLPGWPFVDWAPHFPEGIPPGARGTHPGASASCSVNWLYVLGLRYLAQIETLLGEPDLARRAGRLARGHADRVINAFWDPRRNRFNEDPAGDCVSEQSHVLALLTGELPVDLVGAALRVLTQRDPAVIPSSLYFTHYVLDVLHTHGQSAAFFERFDRWRAFPAVGLRTTPETAEPTRSDCHVWSSHPLYHVLTRVLGVQPGEPGFASVSVAPMLGPLQWAEGVVPHPAGDIAIRAERAEDRTIINVTLPESTPGVLLHRGERIELRPGEQRIELHNEGTA